jgi:hypothetical protein
MIDFCGYKFQVGVQSIHLYPIASNLWDMRAVTVMERLGQVLPFDPRLVNISIGSCSKSLDPDSFGDGVKCFASQAIDLQSIVQCSTKDMINFAKKYAGIAFRSHANDGSWIIKGIARKMVAELSVD